MKPGICFDCYFKKHCTDYSLRRQNCSGLLPNRPNLALIINRALIWAFVFGMIVGLLPTLIALSKGV